MNHSMINPYGLCFCGSGKKFKFCCMKHFLTLGLPHFVEGDIPQNVVESKRLHEEGLHLMQEQMIEKALPLFQRATELNRKVPNPANNWAMCLFALGKTEEAVRIQRQCLRDTVNPNPFGLANLAMMLHFHGEDEAAMNAVGAAIVQPYQDPSSVERICMTLSFYDMHQEILDIIDTCDFEDDPLLHFYAGCASANLGNRMRAVEELSDVNDGNIFEEAANKYLKWLTSEESPKTVRGDWPYLFPSMFFVDRLIQKDEQEMPRLDSIWYVQYVESILNFESKRKKDFLILLKFCTHPEAKKLLWRIAKGSFGPDSLRHEALMILEDKGEIKRNTREEIQTGGEKQDVLLTSIKLNPEYEFCPMPENLEQPFLEILEQTHAEKVDWADIAEQYRKLCAQYPDFFPLENNLAAALLQCRKFEEAEKIMRSILEKHPDYLFSRSGLLNCFTLQERWEDGDKLLHDTVFPEETHPDAYITWALAACNFFMAQLKFSEAESWLKIAKQLDPKDEHIKLLNEKLRSCKKLKKMLEKASRWKIGRK